MPERTAHARWQGNLRDGSGTMQLGSGAFKATLTSGVNAGPDRLLGRIQLVRAGRLRPPVEAALSLVVAVRRRRLEGTQGGVAREQRPAAARPDAQALGQDGHHGATFRLAE